MSESLAAVLASCLRSGVPRLVKAAQAEIQARTRNLKTEKERREALGVAPTTWYEWRREGLVEGGTGKRGRPKAQETTR